MRITCAVLAMMLLTSAGVRAHHLTDPVAHKVKIRVIDAETSQPMAGVRVASATEDRQAQDATQTDGEGDCELTLTCEGTSETIRFDHDDYVPTQAVWDWSVNPGTGKHTAADLPNEFELKLPPGHELHGIVVDDSNAPIPAVAVMLAFAAPEVRRKEWPTVGMANEQLDVFTQPDGRWSTNRAPKKLSTLNIMFGHNDYALQELTADHAESVTLIKGVRLAGKIIDTEGNPVDNADIVSFKSTKYGGPRSAPTNRSDANGEYLLSALPAGPEMIGIIAEGFVHQVQRIDIQPGATLNSTLRHVHTVRGNFRDRNGAPIPNVHLVSELFPDDLDEHLDGQADNDGHFEVTAFPDIPLRVTFSAPGFQTLEMKLAPDSDTTITLQPADASPASTQPGEQPPK